VCPPMQVQAVRLWSRVRVRVQVQVQEQVQEQEQERMWPLVRV
jgi:hypothetical protein